MRPKWLGRAQPASFQVITPPKAVFSAALRTEIPGENGFSRAQFEKKSEPQPTAFLCFGLLAFVSLRSWRISRAASDPLPNLFDHVRSIAAPSTTIQWRVFGEFDHPACAKNVQTFSSAWWGLGTIYTPKHAHGRIFVLPEGHSPSDKTQKGHNVIFDSWRGELLLFVANTINIYRIRSDMNLIVNLHVNRINANMYKYHNW